MIRRLGWFIVVLFLAGCSAVGSVPLVQPDMASSTAGQDPASQGSAQPTPQVGLPDYGPAPELRNDVWLNADQPLRLADLRGKVVLIDMWTYG